jgi:hypothetical protein
MNSQLSLASTMHVGLFFYWRIRKSGPILALADQIQPTYNSRLERTSKRTVRKSRSNRNRTMLRPEKQKLANPIRYHYDRQKPENQSWSRQNPQRFDSA